MSKEIRPDHVAIYIRWSTDDQGDGTTLEVQQEACELYVRSQGWVVRKDLMFIDDGYSGGNLRRPALSGLREAVRAGRVDCVVCFKLDRLSRNVVDTVNLVLEEWDGRCHFKTARDPIDTTTPAGKMFFYLLASYAEWERNVIRERTAGGKLQRAQQGRWASGRPPFGYRLDESKRLVVYEPEAAVVRQVFALYVKGRTSTDILRQLQAEAAPAPTGPGQWTKPLIRKILSSEVYIGVLEYGRFRPNPRHGRDSGAPRLVKADSPHVRLPGAAPAIADEGVFWTVQRMKAERDARATKNSGRAYSSHWLLSAVAKCARCGASMATRGPVAHRRPYYYCVGRKQALSCDCMQISVAELDAWFVQELKQVYGDQVRRQQVFAALEAEQREKLAQMRAGLSALQAAVVKLERERATVRRSFRAGEISAEEYRGFVTEIEQELAGVQERARAVEAEMARAGAQANVRDLAAQLEAVDIFESLDPKDQKHLVYQLVKSMRVYRSPASGEVEATVEWKLPGPAPAPIGV